MRKLVLFSVMLIAAAAAVMFAGPAHVAHVHALALHHMFTPDGLGTLGLGVGFAGTLRHLEPALPYEGLKARRTAGSVGGYRVFPDFIYDTINYPAAGPAAGASLNFFQGVNAASNDKTLTNSANGTVPSPQIFWAQCLTMKIITEATAVDDTANANANLVNDFDRIITSSRSILTWSVSTSTIVQGNIPLSALGSMGGVVPTYGGNNAPAAGHGWVYFAPRLSAHGGFPVDIILFPTEALQVNLTFGIQKAITAQTAIRVEAYGWRYIPVGL